MFSLRYIIYPAQVILASSAIAGITTIDPDSYADRANLTDTVSGVDLRVANDQNVPSDFFKVTANTITLKTPPTGVHVFGQSNVAFWPSSFRFYARFPNLTDQVSIKFTGGSGINAERGLLQAYSSNGTLIDEYLTAPLLHGQVETMTVSSVSAMISHVIAYTPKEYGSFGILDCLQFNSIPLTPDISVEHSGGGALVDGGLPVDFGRIAPGTPVKKSFIIRNVGTSNLTNLSLRLSGLNASNFSVADLDTTTLLPGASTTVSVTFSTPVTGTRSALMQITSNDLDENPFDISLQGTGYTIPAPEIVLQQGAAPANNLISGLSKRDFGSVPLGSSSNAKTFTIKNVGTAKLKGLAVTFRGLQAAEFKLIKAPNTALAPGSSTTFKVIYKPTTTNGSTATLRISSNDANENPFRVKLTGKGIR